MAYASKPSLPSVNLSPGMSGESVRQLQQYLISSGYNIPSGATGYYGNETKAAVGALQQKLGLGPIQDVGYYGPKTMAALGRIPNSSQPGFSSAPAPSTTSRSLSFSSPASAAPTPAPVPAAPATPQAPASSQDTSSSSTDIDKAIDDALQAILSSGYTINPGLTAEDIAAIDPAKFMESAAATIAPEYQQKFSTAADTLKRALGNVSEDYATSVEKTTRESDKTLLEGTETLAGRGLAFSGTREKFIGDVASEKSRSIEDAARTAQRAGQTALSTAEGLIGTTGVQNLGVNTSIGGRNLSFGSTPIVGQYTSEKAYTTEAIARELAQKEAQRRSMATRALSFS